MNSIPENSIKHLLCPTCKTKCTWANNPFRPFCSERCRLLDLGEWLAEKNVVPGSSIDS